MNPNTKQADLTVAELEELDEERRVRDQLVPLIVDFHQQLIDAIGPGNLIDPYDPVTNPDPTKKFADDFLASLGPARAIYEPILMDTTTATVQAAFVPTIDAHRSKITVALTKKTAEVTAPLKAACKTFAAESGLSTPADALNAFIASRTPPEQIEINARPLEFLEEAKAGMTGAHDAENTTNTEKASEVAESMRALNEKLQEMVVQRQRKDIQDLLKGMSQEEQDAANQTFDLIEAQANNVAQLHHMAERLAEWNGGLDTLTPNALKAHIQTTYAGDPALVQGMLHGLNRVETDPVQQPFVDAWNLGNPPANVSDKILLTRMVWEAIDGQSRLGEMSALNREWKAHVAGMQAAIEEERGRQRGIEDEIEKAQQHAGPTSKESLMQRILHLREKGFLGMTVYTPAEVINAFKKVWKAFEDQSRDREESMAIKLASNISAALVGLHVPYGEAVNRRFRSTAESEFNKAKSEYASELGDDDFNTLMRKFDSVRSEPAKAMAIVEKASDHGWLYEWSDMSDEQWPVHIFGVDIRQIIPVHWDENQAKNYVNTTRRKNTAGGKEERQKGHDRIKEQTDANVYIKKFSAALDANNYWSALGIGEALLDRGKMAEASEYLTAKIVQHLRDNPDAKKYMNKTVLEQFSMMKWNESTTFAQNMIAMNMGDMKRMKRDKNVMGGPLLGTIQKLEAEILAAAGGQMDKDTLARNVGAVMSGQTVEIESSGGTKTPISIYQEKYRDYWDESQNAVFGTYKGEGFLKLATDYYAPAAMLQLPSSAVVAIFETGSTGTLDHPDIAQNFAGYAVKRYRELHGSNPVAAEVFRKYMSKKLVKAMSTAFTNNAPKHMAKYMCKEGNTEKDPLVASLVKLGFVRIEEIDKFAKGNTNYDGFMKDLREQVAKVDPA